MRLAVTILALSFAAIAQSFDRPLKKQVVDFGKQEDDPNNTPYILTCSYYRDVMVKQYATESSKGALFLSFQRFERMRPACVREHTPAERVLDHDEWSGYFRGVKGNFVFFDSDDGSNGGMPFAVYDSKTGKKVFRDNAYWAGMWTRKSRPRPSTWDDLRIHVRADGNIVLTYLRVVPTECDIPNKAVECWPPLVKQFELKRAAAPRCTGYEKIRLPDWNASTVAYPVETALFPTPTTKTIAGPVKCWPVY